MKIKCAILFSLSLLSCGQEQVKINESKLPIEMQQETLSEMGTVEKPQILIPFTYRDGSGIDVKLINSNWLELYFDKTNNTWEIDHALFKIKRDEDACSADSTTVLSSSRNVLLFFNGIPIDLGKVSAIQLESWVPRIDRAFKFSFNDKNYMLSSKADLLDQDGYIMPMSDMAKIKDNEFQNYKIEHYALTLSEQYGEAQLLFEVPQFNDNFVKILWIGDLDNDGKPDFIFDTSQSYEVKSVELYLSKGAKTEDYVRKVADINIGFDC